MSEYDAKAAHGQTVNPQLGPKAFETFRMLAPEGLRRNERQLLDLFNVLRSHRLTGRVSRSVVVKLFESLGKYPIQVVRDAIETYLEPGNRKKREVYLVGIARTQTKQDALHGKTHAPPSRQAPTVGLPVAALHLEGVVAWLRGVYADGPLNAEQRKVVVAAAKELRDLSDQCQTDNAPGARDIDDRCAELAGVLRSALPTEIEMICISPYDV